MKPVRFAAPGVVKIGPFGPYKNAVWLFHHQGEAAVVEMPPYRKKEQKPFLAVKKFLKAKGWTLKYALLSHMHVGHCSTLASFRLVFPDTTFVGHESYLHSPLTWRMCARAGMNPDELFDEIYTGDLKILHLGGEPMILIHCPKHSQTDQFVIFRGTAMTGDWFLGDLRDCNALVHPDEKIRSVERVQGWLHHFDYEVSRAFSGHGDCLYYQVDFDKLMEKSKIYHPGLR